MSGRGLRCVARSSTVLRTARLPILLAQSRRAFSDSTRVIAVKGTDIQFRICGTPYFQYSGNPYQNLFTPYKGGWQAQAKSISVEDEQGVDFMQCLDVDRARGERIQFHVKEGEWFNEHDDLLQLHLSGCDNSVDLAIKSLIQGNKLRWKLLRWNVKDGKEGKEETSWDELMDPDFTWFVAQLELQQGDNRASGNCWQSAVDGFRSRVNAKPESERLHFVSLMIPAADLGKVTEHFVYEEDGFVVDPMMVNLSDDRTSLTCDTYYGCLEESAERLGIRPYACSPLRLNKKQFDLLFNIVALSLEIVPSDRTLANCRACVAALIDIWDEAESEQRIAERVIARVHGATVRLKLKEK